MEKKPTPEKSRVPVRIKLAAQDYLMAKIDAVRADDVSDAVAAEVGFQKKRIRKFLGLEGL